MCSLPGVPSGCPEILTVGVTVVAVAESEAGGRQSAAGAAERKAPSVDGRDRIAVDVVLSE